MPDWRSSAAYRIAFTYSAAFALVVAVLGVVVYFAADRSFRLQQDAAISEETASLLRDDRDEGLGDLRERIDAREASSSTNAFGYIVLDERGRRIAGSMKTRLVTPGWHDITFQDPVEGPDPARALATMLPGEITLVVAADTEALEQIDHTILVLFGIAFAFVLAVGVLGASLLGGYLRRRLGRIGGTAQSVMAGELTRRMPIGRNNDEFDAVSRSLNAMLDRIALLLDNLRQVSSDVAHDLRTPLVRMRSGLERALRDQGSGSQAEAIHRALGQSDELLDLFAAILRIAEIESGELVKSFAPVDLAALVEDVCESWDPSITDAGRQLRCHSRGPVLVSADRELLAQALINLLENAQTHTPPGTTITVQLGQNDLTAQLSVADDGPGVDPADRDRITRRFVRLDASRSAPGNGLGLNLVSAVAIMHGGSVEFAENRPGLRAIITLPRIVAP